MKKIILCAAILLSCLVIKTASAQVSVSFGINIGAQPAWGPVGYDRANYYYMPDIDTYYDVPTHQYVYYDNNVWVHRTYLSARYRNYDLYHGYKVVINDRNPWARNDVYRTRYAGYRGRHDQVVIRDSRDARYANHWQGDRGRGEGDDHRGHFDNGNHGGRGPQFHGNGGGHDDHGDHGNRGGGDHGDGEHGGGHGHGHD